MWRALQGERSRRGQERVAELWRRIRLEFRIEVRGVPKASALKREGLRARRPDRSRRAAVARGLEGRRRLPQTRRIAPGVQEERRRYGTSVRANQGWEESVGRLLFGYVVLFRALCLEGARAAEPERVWSFPRRATGSAKGSSGEGGGGSAGRTGRTPPSQGAVLGTKAGGQGRGRWLRPSSRGLAIGVLSGLGWAEGGLDWDNPKARVSVGKMRRCWQPSSISSRCSFRVSRVPSVAASLDIWFVACQIDAWSRYGFPSLLICMLACLFSILTVFFSSLLSPPSLFSSLSSSLCPSFFIFFQLFFFLCVYLP